jgi:hypothetical protein
VIRHRHLPGPALLVVVTAALALAVGALAHGGETVPAPAGMSVTVKATPSMKGVVVHVQTKGFTFAPRQIDGEHVPGRGHVHVYVDGTKKTLMLGPWLYLGDLKPGKRTIRVTLSANNHAEYERHGKPVSATTTVAAPKRMHG